MSGKGQIHSGHFLLYLSGVQILASSVAGVQTSLYDETV